MTVAVSGDSITFPDNSVQATAPKVGMVNRIINGAMVIDQRNAGASVAVTAGYTLDRWLVYEATDGAISVQQVSDAPAGFSNSLKVTTTTADASIGATQYCYLEQRIEGYNFADFSFGSASAQSTAISFQIKSSLTGTFGGVIMNSANNRSYPFTYTINTANTWEAKSIIIAGDTTGTWIGATNGIGLRVIFGLGMGSTYSGTAGAWAGSEYYSATGAVPVISTLNATWQVTGVQLEKGSTATSFDYRPYGTELALCQRYLPAYNVAAAGYLFPAFAYNATTLFATITYQVMPRVAPTGVTTTGSFSGNIGGNTFTATSPGVAGNSTTSLALVSWVTTGATAGQAGYIYAGGSAVTFYFTGCEL